MAYRDADPPGSPEEELALSRMAAAGRQVQRGQAEEAREAQRELALSRSADQLAAERSRLRQLGRKSKPLQGTLVVSSVVGGGALLGGYLLYQTSLHIAIWVHILLWGVCVPSVWPALVLERALAKRTGKRVESKERAWVAAQAFAVDYKPWAVYESASTIRLEVSFENRKPEPQLLADALRAVSSEVLIEVVGWVGNEPVFDDGDGFALRLSHRRSHNAEYWLEPWFKKAMASAFATTHRAFPIASIRVCD